jgi:hypothetical protein
MVSTQLVTECRVGTLLVTECIVSTQLVKEHAAHVCWR